MKMQKAGKRFFAVFAAVIFALSLVIFAAPVTTKAAANANVTAVGEATVHVNLTYQQDGNSEPTTIAGLGSGFLINDRQLMTCAHVIDIDADVIDAVKMLVPEAASKSDTQVMDRLGYSVTVSRDVTISATVERESQEVDWAILNLEQPIVGKKPVTFRTTDVSATEPVYAVGFPQESDVIQDIKTYTSEDVTITQGIVNKVTTGQNLYSGYNCDYMQTSVKLTAGNSGGPMVDEDGLVVGICEGSWGTLFQDDYFYGICTHDQITSVMTQLGIEFQSDSSPAPTETTGEIETEPVTTAAPSADKSALQRLVDANISNSKVKDAIDNAKAVLDDPSATQADVDRALTALEDAIDNAKSSTIMGMSKTLFFIILAAIIVVIAAVVIILLILLNNKKKKAAADINKGMAGPGTVPITPQRPIPPTPQAPTPQAPIPGFTPAPVTPVADAGETTVLQGAGETTVLNRSINGGTLVNAKTGEKIDINAEEFTIGRERSKVNYCIANNTTVGRVHAKIVNRGGVAYLVDLKATNGTFLNGVKCAPMVENALKNGDKVTLSDEEFTYQA